MQLYQWDSNRYSLGITLLDEQHRILIQTIYDLYESINAGSAFTTYEVLLKDLISLCQHHFDSEERLMSVSHYPGIDGHIGLHMNFNDYLRQLVELCQSNQNLQATDALKFLSHWYIEHITNADSHFCHYYQKNTA